MIDGHDRAKKVLKGDKVFQKNNLDSLLNRAIKFKKSRYIDDKLDRFKQKYAPVNSSITSTVKHNSLATADALTGAVDSHGFEHPAKILFSKDKLNPLWVDVQPVGPGLVDLKQPALNAVLHALVFTPAFANYLFAKSHSANCTVQDYCTLCALEDLGRAYFRTATGPLSPRIFVGKLKSMKEGSPSNVLAVWSFFMDQIQHFLLLEKGSKDKRVQQTTALYQIFGGHFQSKMECPACKKGESVYEAFLQLHLDINTANTVEKSLTKMLKAAGASAACSSCEKPLAQAKKSIYHTPMVLVLCLDRFGTVNGEESKNEKMVKFEETMNVKRHVSEDANDDMDTAYKLYAVIVHVGSLHGGRYVTYVKSSNEAWYCLDNDSIQLVSVKSVLSKQAHMVFYTQSASTKFQPVRQTITTLADDVLSTMREKEAPGIVDEDEDEEEEDIEAPNSVDEDEDEDKRRLEKALSNAQSKEKVESKDAIVVEHNETAESKRSKLDALIDREMSQGKSAEVKEQLLAKSAHVQFDDSVGRWDDEDLGDKMEAKRKQALKQAKPKRKRVDGYDLDYDRGKVKKVKNKKKDIFGKPNAFQLQADITKSKKRS